ncbi:MAG: hypothetical protein IK092_06035, partial [Muribaculaceae bacterium]|nr:hypothetical protein [Muribaculaceae bacterium]
MPCQLRGQSSLKLELCQLGVELLAFALFCLVASSYFGFCDALGMTVAFAVAYAIPRIVYSRWRNASMVGRIVLFAVAMLLVWSALSNITFWTLDSGGTLEVPNLRSDDRGYYQWALNHYDGRCPPPVISFYGFSVIMLGLWKVLGVSVVWPIAFNIMLTLLVVVITAMTAVRVIGDKVNSDGKRVAWLAMLLTSLLFHLMSQGVRIQKEATIYLGFALVGYALAGMKNEVQSKRDCAVDVSLFGLGVLLLSFVRLGMSYLILASVLLMGLTHWRHNKFKMLMMVALVGLSFLFGLMVANYTMQQQVVIVDGGTAMKSRFMVGPTQTPYALIIGDYFNYPMWRRVLLLPITSGVQFIVPFPWNYSGMSLKVEASMLARVQWTWYLIGGIAFYYYIFV